MQRALAGTRFADQQRAHQAGVVLAVDAGELERQLVAGVEAAAPRLVATEQGVAPGADDERVAGVVAAALEDRGVHRGEDRALVGALTGLRDRRIERGIGQFRGAANTGELGCGLDQAQAGDQVRGVDRRGEAVERRVQAPAVGRREPVVSYSTPRRLPARPCSASRPRSSAAGLLPSRSTQMRTSSMIEVCSAWRRSGAREQHQIAVGAQHQTLEEAVAERVVAGQPVHALLLEQQQRIQPARRHRRQRPPPRGELLPGEVQGHE